jgi:PAS domain S-box-containing protein
LSKILVLQALCALFFWVAVNTVGSTEAPRAKRVLIISTGSRLAPGFVLVDQQLLQALGKIPSPRIETYAENLDLVRFSSERYQRIFTEYLTGKYADNPPDLVILVFVGNLATPANLLPRLFAGTPIIVSGLTEEEIRPDQFGGGLFSGLAQRLNPGANFELILRLQPEVRRVVVIGGTAEIDRQVLQRVREAAVSFKERIAIDFWDNRTISELRQAVKGLPRETVILFARMFRDGAGQAVISAQVGQWIAQWANVPVYVMSDSTVGTGAVGGAVASIEAFGKRTGELASLVLSGSDIKSLPFEIRTEAVLLFDWRALQRWGIPESRLPAGSVVRFKSQSIWEQYRWYIIGALVVIFIQSVMIFDLLLQRRRRRGVEAELRDSEQLMELATSAGELGLWSRDLRNGKVWANASMRSLFGLGGQDELQFDDLIARIHPDDRARMLSEVAHARSAGLPFQGEFRIVLPTGEQRWLLAKGSIAADSGSNRDQRRLGVVLDITERKRAEEALEKERSFLRQVIDTDPNFIFAKDREGRFTLANKAVADAYGTTVDNLIGRTDADFNPNQQEVESFRQMDLEVIDTLQERFIPEERITNGHGRVRWLQTVKRPIIERDGSAKQVLGASTDITQRKKTEMELREQRAELAHVARISTMGELAASLAHELNQPLTAILSNAQAALRFLSSKPSDIEEVREILQDIVKDNSRAGEVIRRMRALVKKEDLEFVSLDLAGLIRDVVALVHSDAILQNVKISLALDDNLATVLGDKVQLQQVVLNLLLNAFDSMKDCSPREREVKLRAELYGANMIRVAVNDRGIGLSVDKLDKIFEPFYTTKSEGLGMGLSICRSIIEAHSGRLWAENNADSGATFYFTLPVEAGTKEEWRDTSAQVGSGDEGRG